MHNIVRPTAHESRFYELFSFWQPILRKILCCILSAQIIFMDIAWASNQAMRELLADEVHDSPRRAAAPLAAEVVPLLQASPQSSYNSVHEAFYRSKYFAGSDKTTKESIEDLCRYTNRKIFFNSADEKVVSYLTGFLGFTAPNAMIAIFNYKTLDFFHIPEDSTLAVLLIVHGTYLAMGIPTTLQFEETGKRLWHWIKSPFVHDHDLPKEMRKSFRKPLLYILQGLSIILPVARPAIMSYIFYKAEVYPEKQGDDHSTFFKIFVGPMATFFYLTGVDRGLVFAKKVYHRFTQQEPSSKPLAKPLEARNLPAQQEQSDNDGLEASLRSTVQNDLEPLQIQQNEDNHSSFAHRRAALKEHLLKSKRWVEVCKDDEVFEVYKSLFPNCKKRFPDTREADRFIKKFKERFDTEEEGKDYLRVVFKMGHSLREPVENTLLEKVTAGIAIALSTWALPAMVMTLINSFELFGQVSPLAILFPAIVLGLWTAFTEGPDVKEVLETGYHTARQHPNKLFMLAEKALFFVALIPAFIYATVPEGLEFNETYEKLGFENEVWKWWWLIPYGVFELFSMGLFNTEKYIKFKNFVLRHQQDATTDGKLYRQELVKIINHFIEIVESVNDATIPFLEEIIKDPEEAGNLRRSQQEEIAQ